MTQQTEPTDGDILVVEDDADIRELIMAQLRREPYHVRATGSLAGVRAAIKKAPVKLMVLDLGLRDGDGLTLCRELRSEGYEGAIIMVTARDTPIDRVLGLELGADDYLTKPFEPRELLARVRNLLRRLPDASHPGRRNARFAYFGSWRLDLHQRRLIAASDRLVMLSSAEFRLLCLFIDAPGKVLSRELLRPARSAAASIDRAIDLQISRLRHKLATEQNGIDVILTVRNEGYVMPGPVTFE